VQEHLVADRIDLNVCWLRHFIKVVIDPDLES
jgi:hypothetical protein